MKTFNVFLIMALTSIVPQFAIYIPVEYIPVEAVLIYGMIGWAWLLIKYLREIEDPFQTPDGDIKNYIE